MSQFNYFTFAARFRDMYEPKLPILKEININFNLRQKLLTNKPANIHYILRYNNQRVVIYAVEKINPRYWNLKSQKAQTNQRNPEGFDLNEILERQHETFELTTERSLSSIYTPKNFSVQ